MIANERVTGTVEVLIIVEHEVVVEAVKVTGILTDEKGIVPVNPTKIKLINV